VKLTDALLGEQGVFYALFDQIEAVTATATSVAPWTLFKPTPPVPITTTVLPAGTRAVLTTAPSPVMTPQASKEAHSNDISSGMGTIWDCSTTTYSAKAPVRRPW